MEIFKRKQNHALEIATVIALVFGAYFLRPFFGLIVFAAIMAFIFNPVYQRLTKKYARKGTAASLTLVISMLMLIIPLSLIVVATIYQIQHLLNNISSDDFNFGSLGQDFANWFNSVTSHFSGIKPITAEQVQQAVSSVAAEISKTFLGIITSAASGIAGFVTDFIIFIYVFINLLIFQDNLVELVRKLNPLGTKRTDTYLAKMGSMTKAMARGQFIIATVQGFTDAVLLYIAGLHSVFLFMFLILTVLSIIPLGGGIIVLPIGFIMLLTGHIWQGLLVILGHLLIVTNEDNILRPKLVPKDSYLNPALTLLSVFSGIAMFGFLGIIIGPVIMILIVSTIRMYLEAKAESKKA